MASLLPTVVPLSQDIDRASFECGVISLDNFFRKAAMQYESRRIGRTFVLTEPPSTVVAGFYTLASAEIDLDELPAELAKRLPRHPLPCVRLCRLAVDLKQRGKGLGATLLRDALRRCVSLSEHLGVYAVIVDALDARAAGFYRRYQFIPTSGNPLKLFLPISTIVKAQIGE